MGFDQPSHWLVIIVIAALLFGYKKLPDMARSAGRSMRLFKTEIKGMADDDEARREHDDKKPAPATDAQAAANQAQAAANEAQAQASRAQAQQPPAALPAAPVTENAPHPPAAPQQPAQQPTTVSRSSDPAAPHYE